MEKVLVTGANGFVGSHIVGELLARGFSVRALVRWSSDLSFLDLQHTELALGDVTDLGSLLQALAGVQGVIHCAGLTKALSLDQYRKANRDGTENLLRACCAVTPRPVRVVCLSSLAAFGPSRNRAVGEVDAPHPVSEYGRSKLEGHRAAESFMGELSVSILIPPAVYGPRDRDIYAYFKLAKMGITPLLGRAERYLSLIYVKDLARAAALCLVQEQAASRAYFVEDGESHTWRSLARSICDVMRKKPAFLVIPESVARAVAILADGYALVTRRPALLGRQKMRELLQPSWTCSGERIRRELGFQAQYRMSKGLEDTWHWYVDSHWL